MAFRKLFACTFALAAVACSGGDFGGGTNKAKGSAAPETEPEDEPSEAGETQVDQGEAVAGEDQPSATVGEEDGAAPAVIVECVKDWPNHPFTPAQLAKPTVVEIDQENNNNATTFKDDDETAEPKLTMVVISSKNVNNGKFFANNPNGWYCIDVRSKAANNFTITAACKAHIATLSHSSHVENGFSVQRPGC